MVQQFMLFQNVTVAVFRAVSTSQNDYWCFQLVTWMLVDCNLAVRCLLSVKLCATDQFKNDRYLARLQTPSLGDFK